MKKFIRLLFVAALIVLGFFAWRFFFPSPERAIRSNLHALAKAASFDGSEGDISRALKADRVAGFFTLEVEILIDMPGYPAQTLTSRTEIRQMFLGAQSRLRTASVEFLDVNVTLEPGGESAIANLTLDLHTGRERAAVQELNVTFKKIEGKWLISKVETVKILSGIATPALLAAIP